MIEANPQSHTRRVYRYEVANGKTSQIAEGKVVHVGSSRYRSGHAEVWVETDTQAIPAWIPPQSPHELLRSVEIFGTGDLISPGARHLGTYTEGPFVWHVYEVGSTA